MKIQPPGAGALFSNTTGDNNTANGTFALFSNSTGATNTANGSEALLHNTDGTSNTAVGFAALSSNLIGNANTAIGDSALSSNTAGSNTAVGFQVLHSNTTGEFNTAIGWSALSTNTIDSHNTATGVDALVNNVGASFNTANGNGALMSVVTNNNNTATGYLALGNATGSNNTALGAFAGSKVMTADNVICIGANLGGADTSNTCFIGNIFGATSSGGTAVFINSSGQLGTATSSRRFKDEIEPINKASEALFALNPVTFRYKKELDPAGTSQFGLVAEDVEKVNRDLVVRDKEGKPYSVRYDAVNAMLLNEFLKEHRTVQELKSVVAKQEATAARQQKQIEALTVGLQKVSAQLQVKKSEPQTVQNAR